MMIEVSNSQTYGPSQVRDLSESWGKSVSKVKTGRVSTSGLASPHLHTTAPVTEYTFPVSVISGYKGALHCVLLPGTLKSGGSLLSTHSRKGARFSRVRGSIPPATIYGTEYRPVYSTSMLQRINTLAVKKYCGS